MVQESPGVSNRTIMRRSDWDEIAAVFALVIGFAYSDDLVEFLAVRNGASYADWRWMVVVIDIGLVLGSAVLKWDMAARPRPVGLFLRDLLRSRWALGAVLVVALHAILLGIPITPVQRWAVADSAWLTLLVTTLFVVAMGLLLVSALGGTERSRGWVVPVVLGTLVAQWASVMWGPLINVDSGCANDVSTDYFNAMVQILPVFLVTLGLEVNYLRGSRRTLEPGQRAAPVITVILLCVGEALTLSVLIKTDDINCGPGAVWHEYITFILTTHAAAISLATLAWLLLSSPGHEDEPGA